jgi:hypothetical protein
MNLVRLTVTTVMLATTVAAGGAFADVVPGKSRPAQKAPAAQKPSPAPAATVSQAEAAEWLAYFDKLVDTAVAAKSDCDKMARDITTLNQASKDVLAKAQKAQEAGKKLPKAAEDHMRASVEKMIPAMQACSQNPKVQAALQPPGTAK